MGTVMAEASVIFEVWQSIDYWYQIVQIALRDSPIVRLEGIGDAIPAVVIVADRLQTEEKANRTGVRCGIRYVGTVDLPKIEIWIKRGLGERILLKPYKGPIDHLIFLNPEGDLVEDHYPRARQLLREQNRIMFITSGPGILMLIRIFLALQNENVGRKVYIYTCQLQREALMELVMEGISRRRYLGTTATADSIVLPEFLYDWDC